MDPARWPNGELGELERRMLEAAKTDRVPDALSARMAEAIGVQAGSAAGSGIAASGKAGAPLFAKAGLWGVLSLAVAAGFAGWHATRGAPRARGEAQPVVASASLQPAAPQAPAQARATETAPVDDAALRAEIALLDHARTALQAGAAARALHLLEQHRTRFAPARLAPEAAALRIEALVRRGAHEQAEAMSQQFERAYPAHPLRERVVQLTRGE